jgi:hypothetical protein
MFASSFRKVLVCSSDGDIAEQDERDCFRARCFARPKAVRGLQRVELNGSEPPRW